MSRVLRYFLTAVLFIITPPLVAFAIFIWGKILFLTITEKDTQIEELNDPTRPLEIEKDSTRETNGDAPAITKNTEADTASPIIDNTQKNDATAPIPTTNVNTPIKPTVPVAPVTVKPTNTVTPTPVTNPSTNTPQIAPNNEPAVPVVKPVENIVYVNADNGSNSNDGTTNHPWKTIQHAVNNANGKKIHVYPGKYVEQIVISKSNTTIAGISANGAKPLISGQIASTSNCHPQERCAVFTIRAANVVIEGLEITNDFSQYADQNEHLPVTAFDIGPGSRDVVIRGNDIHNITRNPKNAANYALPIIVSNISSATPVNHIIITNNTIRDCLNINPLNPLTGKTKFSNAGLLLNGNVENIEISANTFKNLQSTGIEITGNYAFGKISSSLDHARKIVVRGNSVENIGEHGIYVNGGQNVLIERNYLHLCKQGIGIVTEVRTGNSGNYTGNIWARDNIINNSSRAGISAGIFGDYKSASRKDYDPVKNIYITNNSFFTASNPPSPTTDPNNTQLHQSVYLLPGIEGSSAFANNIIATRQRLLTAYFISSSINIGKNVWYSTYGKTESCLNTGSGLLCDTLNTFINQSNSKLSGNTYQTPDFKDFSQISANINTKEGFALKINSFAIDKGVSIAAPTWANFGDCASVPEQDALNLPRKSGSAIDIGATEYQQ